MLVIPPQAQERGEELRRIAELLAQRARPGVRGLHLRRCVSLGEDQRGAEGGEQREFLLPALGSVRRV